MVEKEFDFESLVEKASRVDTEVKSLEKKNKNVSRFIQIIIILVSFFIGFKWHLSIGGKLLIFSSLLLTILVVRSLKYKQPKSLYILVLLFITLSWIIAAYEYKNGANSKIDFLHKTFQTGVGEQVIIDLKFGESLNIRETSIRSSNDRIASYSLDGKVLMCHNEGQATIEVKDKFGHSTSLDVQCTYDKNGTIYTRIPSYVKMEDLEWIFQDFFDVSSNQTDFEYEVFDNNIVEVVGNDIIPLQEGTTWIRPLYEQSGETSREITVLKQGAFVIGTPLTYNAFSVGDKVDLKYMLMEELRDKDLKISNNNIHYENGIIEFIKPVSFGFTVSHEENDETTSQFLQFSVSEASSLNAIYFPQVTDGVLKISSETKFEMKPIPSYSSIENVDVVIVNTGIVELERNNLIPKNKGETEIVVYLNESVKKFKVIVE